MACSCAFSAAALSRSVSISALVAASLTSNWAVLMKKACASNSRAYARVISCIASSASFTAAALSALAAATAASCARSAAARMRSVDASASAASSALYCCRPLR